MTRRNLVARLEFGKINDIAKALHISFEDAKKLLHIENKMERPLSRKSQTEWNELNSLLEDDDYLYR